METKNSLISIRPISKGDTPYCSCCLSAHPYGVLTVFTNRLPLCNSCMRKLSEDIDSILRSNTCSICGHWKPTDENRTVGTCKWKKGEETHYYETCDMFWGGGCIS